MEGIILVFKDLPSSFEVVQYMVDVIQEVLLMIPNTFDPVLTLVFTILEHLYKISETGLLLFVDIFRYDQIWNKYDVDKNSDKSVQGGKQNRKMPLEFFVFDTFDIADIAEYLINEIGMHISGMSGDPRWWALCSARIFELGNGQVFGDKGRKNIRISDVFKLVLMESDS